MNRAVRENYCNRSDHAAFRTRSGSATGPTGKTDAPRSFDSELWQGPAATLAGAHCSSGQADMDPEVGAQRLHAGLGDRDDQGRRGAPWLRARLEA